MGYHNWPFQGQQHTIKNLADRAVQRATKKLEEYS